MQKRTYRKFTAALKMVFNYQWVFWPVVTLTLSWVMVSYTGAVTLKELQDRAVNNRKIIERYRIETRMAEHDVQIRKSAFLPSVDVSYITNTLDEDSTYENSENSALTGAISYNLFSGYKHRYQLKASEYMKESKTFDLQRVIQDIHYSVAVRYLDLFGKKRRLTVAEDEYKLLQKRYQDASNRYNVGLIMKNELLKIKVEMDDAQQGLKRAKADYQKSANLLAYEIDGRIDPESLMFEEFESIPQIEDYAYYETRMLENRSEIKSLQEVLQSMQYTAKATRSDRYPSVDVSASYSMTGDDYFIGIGDDNEDEIRIQMIAKMNLYDGQRKHHAIRKAEKDVHRIEKDMYELKKGLSTELKNVFLDYEVSLENLEASRSNISQTEENLRITDVAFNQGVSTATDVLDAIFFVSRAKYRYITDRNQVFYNYYNLLRMIDGY